mgnify:FL=1
MVAIILYDPKTPGLEEPEYVATIREEYITILRLASAGLHCSRTLQSPGISPVTQVAEHNSISMQGAIKTDRRLLKFIF